MDSNQNNNPPGFFTRLKQHHIYRVAAWYGASITVLIQIVARAFPYFDWSAAVPAVIIILIAGFPVALVLAWLLVKPADSASQTIWQRRHWMLGVIVTPLVIVAVVVSGIFAFRFSERHEARVAAEQAVAQAEAKPAAPVFNPPADSIVVLPFVNMSDDPKQQYFSNGITEELTGALGQTTGLTVIAWDTASRFSTSKQSPAEIGKALNVAHIVDGSIEREGDQVRVSAELVSTVTGQQLWSAHYDDSLKNIFAVQDKVSAAIAGALKVKFASLGPARTINPEAYDLVLKAHALMDKARSAASIEQARTLYEQAIALDPAYADAHAGLAGVWYELPEFTTLPIKDALPKVRAEANQALALDPRNVAALVQLGNADSSGNQIAKAKSEYQRALALDPSNADAHQNYGNLLPQQQSPAQALEAVQLDPDNANAQNSLAVDEMELGEYAQALAAWQAALRLDPHSVDNAYGLALGYSQLHRDQDAAKAFDLAQPATPLDKALIAAGRLTYQSVINPRLHAQALAAVDALRRHADLDPTSMGNVLQLYLTLGRSNAALQVLQKWCAALGCGNLSNLSRIPLFAPLRGQPRFEALVKQYDTVSKPPTSTTSPPAPSP